MNIFRAFLQFSLDRTIWKMSRHDQFDWMCAAHLAHPEYMPLFLCTSRCSCFICIP